MNKGLIVEQTRAFIAELKKRHLSDLEDQDENTKYDAIIDLGGIVMDEVTDAFDVTTLCEKCSQ